MVITYNRQLSGNIAPENTAFSSNIVNTRKYSVVFSTHIEVKNVVYDWEEQISTQLLTFTKWIEVLVLIKCLGRRWSMNNLLTHKLQKHSDIGRYCILLLRTLHFMQFHPSETDVKDDQYKKKYSLDQYFHQNNTATFIWMHFCRNLYFQSNPKIWWGCFHSFE